MSDNRFASIGAHFCATRFWTLPKLDSVSLPLFIQPQRELGLVPALQESPAWYGGMRATEEESYRLSPQASCTAPLSVSVVGFGVSVALSSGKCSRSQLTPSKTLPPLRLKRTDFFNDNRAKL